MSEPSPPPPPTDAGGAPPPPPPSGGSSGGGQAPSNRNLMLICAYFGPLALVPLLTEPNDADLQWHAKHGLVLLGAEIAFSLVLSILVVASGGLLGCFLVPVFLLAAVAIIVLHVAAMMQAINGKRLNVPGLTPLVERF